MTDDRRLIFASDLGNHHIGKIVVYYIPSQTAPKGGELLRIEQQGEKVILIVRAQHGFESTDRLVYAWGDRVSVGSNWSGWPEVAP